MHEHKTGPKLPLWLHSALEIAALGSDRMHYFVGPRVMILPRSLVFNCLGASSRKILDKRLLTRL